MRLNLGGVWSGVRGGRAGGAEQGGVLAGGCGEDYLLEPVKLWVRGVDGDSPMTAVEAARFAGLMAQAASVMARITGGAVGAA